MIYFLNNYELIYNYTADKHTTGVKQLVIRVRKSSSYTNRFEQLPVFLIDANYFDLLCLSPLAAIFQLYHGDQF
jgi:hypothetical protein